MISEHRENKIRNVYAKRQKDLAVVLENIWDPHNVSAIYRSCDAVGVDKVYLVYPEGNFPKLSEASSASAKKWVKTEKFKSIEECYARLHKEGLKIYSTYIPQGLFDRGENNSDKQNNQVHLSLFDLKLYNPSALVFGNEHEGVSVKAYQGADANFLIPMVGMIQSLNVSVSVAVSLYEAMRQRMKKGKYNKSQYSLDEIDSKVNEIAWEKVNKRLGR